MRLLLIAAVALMTAGSLAAPGGGGDRCRYGPSYWCSSVGNAVSCNAFTHCLQTVWEPQLLDVLQTEVCLSSQELVETARRVRSVEGKIQAPLVISLCNAAEDETVKQQCQTTVSMFTPHVLGLLESRMEAASVAALLGLCELYDDSVALEPEYIEGSQPSQCQDCHTFLADLTQLLTRLGAEKEVLTVVEDGVCSKLGDLEIWCKAVVDVAVPRLTKFLEESKEADKLCGLSSFCDDSQDLKLKANSLFDVIDHVFSDIEMDTDVICHDCEKVLTSMLTFDKESLAKTSLEHTMAHLCSMTSLDEEKCRKLWEGFSHVAEDLIHAVSSDVDVPYVCQVMVGCSGREAEVTDDSAYTALPPADLLAPPVPPVPVQESQSPQSPHCSQCLRVMDDVTQLLHTEQAVEQTASVARQTLCSQVGTLEEQCNRLVDVFVPVITEWLTTSDSSRQVCSELTACPNPSDGKSMDLVKMFGAFWPYGSLAEVGSFGCDACQVLVEDARAADRNPDVQETIVNFFNELCDKLGQEAPQCKALVQQYSPQLFEIIASELEPTVLCELLLHCTKPEVEEEEEQTIETDESVPQIEAENVVIGEEPVESGADSQRHSMKKAKMALKKGENSVECTVCKLLMERVDNAITANSTEEKLRKTLEEACGLVPGSLSHDCALFVDTYTPTLLHFLVQQLDPLMVCDELEFCKKSWANSDQHSAASGKEIIEDVPVEEQVEEKELPRETIQCGVCQQVVKSLDTVLAQEKTEAAVQKALDEACGEVAGEAQSQCLHFVDQFSSVVTEMLLLQDLPHQQVCTFLALCPRTDPAEAGKAVKIALPELKTTPVPRTGDANASHDRRQQQTVLGEPGRGGGEECLLCQTVANYLQEALGDPTSQQEVDKLLEEVCSLLPDNLTSSCDSVVEQFIPLIFQLLKDEFNPLEICQKLKLCAPGAHEGRLQVEALTRRAHERRVQKQPALGEEACTYGPSFWCASMENARHCGMVQECLEKYGMKP